MIAPPVTDPAQVRVTGAGRTRPHRWLVHSLLEASARRAPAHTALICGSRRLTYRELDRAANRLANALIELGVRRGDRVIIQLDNSVEAVVAFFGTLKAGAVASIVAASRAKELAHVLTSTTARVLVTAPTRRRRGVLDEIVPSLPELTVLAVGSWEGAGDWSALGWQDVLHAASPVDPGVPVGAADLATLIWTSGTTGEPKGVMSAHADTCFAAHAMTDYLEADAADVVFSALPLTHTYGLYQLITTVLIGGTLVLARDFTFPAQALQVMESERVTALPAVPTMLTVLLRQDLGHYDLSALRYVTNAASALTGAQVSALRKALPHVRLFAMYGQTECKRASYLPPEDIDRRPNSVGVPLPGTRAHVVDEHGLPVPPGVVGELVLEGPHLMRGYWGRPAETAVRLRSGPDGTIRLHTGDLFRTDEDGYLYFVSRSDDIIKSRGEKVSPLEIEDTIRSLPGVAGVAALGVPDDLLGEAVKVVVVPDGSLPLTERDVRAHCAARLADFMVPSCVEFRTELPVTENGKLLRRELRSCAG